MSDIDKEKEDSELKCFQQAVMEGRTLQNKTGEILRFLNGEPVARNKKDRPDLVRICLKGKKATKAVVVGIEHFLVNQVSKRKGNKIISHGKESEQLLRAAYKKGHAELTETETVSEKNARNLMEQAGEYNVGVTESTYEDFITAFKSHIERHIKQVPGYRNNLVELGMGQDIEIALLIEIQTFCPELYLHRDNQFSVNESRLIPITYEMVKVMEKIDKKQVDYIILYQTGLPIMDEYSPQQRVIAIRTGNICKHLAAQNIPVFHYIESMPTSKVQTCDVKLSDDGMCALSFKVSSDTDNFGIEEYSAMLHKMYIFHKNNTPFMVEKIGHDLWMASKKYIIREKGDVDAVLAESGDRADICKKMKESGKRAFCG